MSRLRTRTSSDDPLPPEKCPNIREMAGGVSVGEPAGEGGGSGVAHSRVYKTTRERSTVVSVKSPGSHV